MVLSNKHLETDVERSLDYLEDHKGLSLGGSTMVNSGKNRNRPNPLPIVAVSNVDSTRNDLIAKFPRHKIPRGPKAPGSKSTRMETNKIPPDNKRT